MGASSPCVSTVWVAITSMIMVAAIVISGVLAFLLYRRRREVHHLQKKLHQCKSSMRRMADSHEKLGKKVNRLKRKSSSSKSSKSSSRHSPKSARKASKFAWGEHSENSIPSRSIVIIGDESNDKVMRAPRLTRSDLDNKLMALDAANLNGQASCDHGSIFVSMPSANTQKELVPRTQEEMIRTPMTPEEFLHYMKEAAEIVADYQWNSSKNYKVTTDQPVHYIINQLPRSAPIHPQPMNLLFDDLRNLIIPGMTQWQHEKFLAYFSAGRSLPDVIAETLIAGFGAVGFSYDSCPAITELEVAMINWIGRALGIPEHFLYQNCAATSTGGGAIMPSASDTVFCAVLASRDWKIQKLMKERGLIEEDIKEEQLNLNYQTMHKIGSKLVAYASKDAHSCLEKGCKMAMIRLRKIQGVEAQNYGITGEQLEEVVKQDIELGLIPSHVHVTLGTTSSGAFDKLDTVWPVCRKYNLWLHVDAAWAGSTWIDPKFRDVAKGIENAMSININMNKLMRQSSPCAVVFCADQNTFKKAFDITPTYLAPKQSNTLDLRHWGIQLTHTFRSLKVWSVMRSYGIEGLKHYINSQVDATILLESLVVQHPNVRMFGKRNLALFSLQYVEPGMNEKEINEATVQLTNLINNSRELFVTRSCVDRHDILRLTITLERITTEAVHEIHKIFVDLLGEFKQMRERGEQVGNATTPHPYQPIRGSPARPHTATVTPPVEKVPVAVARQPITFDPILDFPLSYTRTTKPHPKKGSPPDGKVVVASGNVEKPAPGLNHEPGTQSEKQPATPNIMSPQNTVLTNDQLILKAAKVGESGSATNVSGLPAPAIPTDSVVSNAKPQPGDGSEGANFTEKENQNP